MGFPPLKQFPGKNIFKKSKHHLRAFSAKCRQNFSPDKITLTGSSWGIFMGFALAAFASGLVYVGALGLIPVLITILSLLIISILGAFLFISLLRLLARIHYWLAVAILTGIPAIMMFFHLTLPGSLLVFFIITACSAMIGGALWQFRKKWKSLKMAQRITILASLLLGVSGLSGGLIWLLHPGQPVESPVNAAMSVENLPPVLDLQNPGEPGSYTVGYLTYGSGDDKRRKEFGAEVSLITETVDGSTFLDSWTGFSGKMRTRYFGFDAKQLPLNARVWYPEGEGPFPLVLIVHGNHLAQNFSDPGYAYLGELLASRGYILASVDQNFLNGSYTDIPKGLSNENDARGWLLLKHLEAWRQWNIDDENIFFGKVDMENIALIGHSRGGEAVGHAALFNQLPYYPDNANEIFDFNFTIRSIIAIAPCDGQYQPAQTRTFLTDINYLVIQGSHDADVTSYQGMRLFNRISFSNDFNGFKAGVYIWGANHGQFNSVWGKKDFPGPRINFYNLAQLMSEEEQQTISKTYISAFLDATIHNKAYHTMFRDYRHARHWLPETIYISQYEQPGTTYICTFMEDLDLSSGTLAQSTIHASDLSIWREQTVPLIWGDYNTRALIVGWNTTESDTLMPAYHINWPAESFLTGRQSILVFSIAETTEKAPPPGKDGNKNKERTETDHESPADEEQENSKPEKTADNDEEKVKLIDFTIRLADNKSSILEFPLSSFAPVQPTLKRDFTKLSFMQNQAESEIILQYFYFPLEAFADEHPEFDFEKINCVSFIFNITQQGAVVINDLGFID
jgi:dienelactone hydrolase